MICLYAADESLFEHNGLGILDNDLKKCHVEEVLNNLYTLTAQYPLGAKFGKSIRNGMIIKAPAPNGYQLFRIYQSKPSMGMLEIHAFHIFYDLAFNFVEDTNIVSKSGQAWLQQLSQNTQYSHPFTFFSDISTVAGSRVVRKNCVEILLNTSLDNSFVNRFGGEILRDNFNVYFNRAIGENRGFKIRHKKNLKGYTANIDDKSVITRIMPIGFDGLLLPEKYVDSPRISDYPFPRISKVEVDVKAAVGENTDAKDAIPLNEAYTKMRALIKEQFGVIDVPTCSYEVDFVELSKTKEYADFQNLETVRIGDTVTVSHDEDGFYVEAKVIRYEYDSLAGRLLRIEAGQFESRSSNNSINQQRSIEQQLEDVKIETSNMVQVAANGKNTIYRGVDRPTNANVGDLWYEPLENSIVLKQWSGVDWELIPISDQNLGNVNVNNLSGNYIDVRRFRISSGDRDILYVNEAGEVILNAKRIQIDFTDVATKTDLQEIELTPGPQGPPGRDGVDGIAGKDGVGIVSTDITYYLSTSGITTPTTGWSSSVPTLIKGRYLWTRTIWTYSDGNRETGYQVTYIAQDGNSGADGLPGKDGVGISSTTITYASSSSGTTAPSSGWTTAVPNVSQGQYLWTKTIWSYTDNTSETGYSVARMGADGTGHLMTWNFYKLSDSTTPPQVVPIGASTNLSQLGPNNTWTPFIILNAGETNGWNVIDFDKIAKSDIIPDRPFTWSLDASFDGVSNFNGSTDFNIKFENWYTDASGTKVYNRLGTRDFTASNFSATNDTTVTNYFSQSITWTVPRAVYDDIPEGGFLNLRIRIDRFTKLSYHAKNSYVTYGTIPSDKSQLGLGNYSTYGWKPNPEAVTQSLPYLWMYQIQFYDNGREIAIPPAIIGAKGIKGIQGIQGIPGVKGADGKTQYTHIAYADNATGGGFSQTDQTKAYIGMYQDFTATDSTNPASYRWTKWKGSDGAQGIPGPKGADGQTPYIHFAYSDNADGTGLTLTDNGQQYMGHYSDYTQADSTDKTKYTWADRWAKIEVGGKNYIRDFGFAKNYSFNLNQSIWQFERIADSTARSGYHIKATCTSAGGNGFHRIFRDLRGAEWQGRTMTYAVDVKASKSVRMRLGVEAFNKGYKAFDVTTEWQRFISTDTVNYKTYYSFPFYTDSVTWSVGDVIYLRDLQLEDGTVATTPRAAEEDVREDIDSKADQALTQQQLNLLIEKAQLMQTELEAKAAMETLSDLERAYNAYVEANDKAVAKSEADLIEAGRRVDGIVETLGGLSKTKTFIDTYIKEADEGIIIGTNDNVSQIRVTYDRIAMYSAGKEVMYISQGVINIDNGVFTKSLQIGRFRTEQHPTNLDINVCRYVG